MDIIIGLVAHDAGGAELLANYAKQNPQNYRFVLDGPAVTVFRRTLGDIKLEKLEEVLPTCKHLICGTSWQSNLEYDAIRFANDFGIKSISFLDHWIHYDERFTRDGVKLLPDEMWVGDEWGYKIAKSNFPLIPIRLVPNPYFMFIKESLKHGHSSSKKKLNTVLFVSENISEFSKTRYNDPNYFGYNEFDSINYFLSKIDRIEKNIDCIKIRPHPSDSDGKYHEYLKYDSRIKISKGSTLLEDLEECQIVVGAQSMAMVVGLMLNKKVISSIPPEGKPCQLPHSEILNLRNLI